MKALIFGGSGKMGRAVAYDLVREPSVEAVGLVGRSREALASAREWIRSHKIVLHALNISDKAATQTLMREYTAGVNTLPDPKFRDRMVLPSAAQVAQGGKALSPERGGPRRASRAFRLAPPAEREIKAPSPFGRKSLPLGKHLQRRR